MPKTKLQELAFTMMMTAVMAYIMCVYNVAINGGGLENSSFLSGLHEFAFEYVIAVFCAFFIGNNIAKKLAFKIVNPKEDKPIFIMLAISVFTVCVMVPLMSFIAVAKNYGITSNFLPIFLTSICLNFIMALPLQIFLAGPLVRFAFTKLFVINR